MQLTKTVISAVFCFGSSASWPSCEKYENSEQLKTKIITQCIYRRRLHSHNTMHIYKEIALASPRPKKKWWLNMRSTTIDEAGTTDHRYRLPCWKKIKEEHSEFPSIPQYREWLLHMHADTYSYWVHSSPNAYKILNYFVIPYMKNLTFCKEYKFVRRVWIYALWKAYLGTNLA